MKEKNLREARKNLGIHAVKSRAKRGKKIGVFYSKKNVGGVSAMTTADHGGMGGGV